KKLIYWRNLFMKLFNRKSKNQIISELKEEVNYLQAQVDNSEYYFAKIKEVVDKIENEVVEIRDIVEDDMQQHKVQMLKFTVQSLTMKLIGQNQGRINIDLKRRLGE